MKAVTFQGEKAMETKNVDDPKIQENSDMIVRITASGICGSDLHLYHGGIVPKEDYVVGHEPMGIVEEVGSDVKNLKKGDRVVIPFNIGCGECFFCNNQMESQCDNSNPHGEPGGLFGFADDFGNHPGGQAEYLRVPYADFTSFKVPKNSELDDEQVLFLSDVIPTAYWSVEHGGVKEGDTVIILGSGPIGLMAQKFAWLKGAKRVITVDQVEHRLDHAKKTNNVETYNFKENENIGELLHEETKGGADVVIDCVGMDGTVPPNTEFGSKGDNQFGTISPIITASQAVRKFGTVQITGVYGTEANGFPLGDFFTRNVSLKMGQAPVINIMPKLYDMIENKEFDPTDIITHRVNLDDAAIAYDIFDKKEDESIKVIFKP
ncbi:zinc-dependent alcohol dehydrogenase [Oceanobacillus profundus]|uniref:Glutathione-dependent formaldehyde dehydrogenase n=1 Tax=Oceanobacillus profundus TaxID=372463 RepID=A0A417YMM3_9BACI|nr:zinc-dependent alcohol dehydrogenase [Oceanobacillus profundus]MBR3118649.1 glutathione-dependent formaldehyde dehydrogenase [Oceanobacillus sp.]PAE29186.1 glutathione-dependent formaldehyde dehydrogenase [Paenibacillus sp. 7884-2]MCM3398229.1 glutathione-dependent formaldehyde dehydrogenase [Oceanobacillus profundus]MDO6447868.1 zinc-dependent alcohol dehydrogenase [Oceanobacillus profundus]RHW35062.1 glutathione-dependent formaldehyde dehydrogenase [Oceanobacillus profundus]